jgi:branched-chain amino acid transport system ATP-binding protein
MLTLKGVYAGYGNIRVLKGIELEVLEGEIVTLIGANGAGKSTILRVITGMLKPEMGEVQFLGENLLTMNIHEIAERGISMVPEGRRIFPRLTLLENLELGGFGNRKNKKIDVKALMEEIFSIFPTLEERRNQIAGTLSGGEQQMLAIARALMATPRLLLIDEPSLGLAPLLVRRIFEVIKEIHGKGNTVLLVEQNARLSLKIADRGYVLSTGEIVVSGSAQELQSNEMVQRAYLGGKSRTRGE